MLACALQSTGKFSTGYFHELNTFYLFTVNLYELFLYNISLYHFLLLFFIITIFLTTHKTAYFSSSCDILYYLFIHFSVILSNMIVTFRYTYFKYISLGISISLHLLYTVYEIFQRNLLLFLYI